jgi:integrase
VTVAVDVVARAGRLWARVVVDGRTEERATPYAVGDEPLAARFATALQAALEAARAADTTPTVASFGARWLARRREKHNVTLRRWQQTGSGRVAHRAHATDTGRWRRYVDPFLGQLRIVDVAPRDIVRWLDALEATTELTAKSRREAFALLGAAFRDAVLEGLVETSPCAVVPMSRAGERDHDGRGSGRYTPAQVARLVGDPALGVYQRTFVALGALAGLRLGAAVGVRWGDLDASSTPWRLTSRVAYGTRPTKTGKESVVPVHPVLRELLSAWRPLWVSTFGREPAATDLVLSRIVARRPRDIGRPHSPTTATLLMADILRTLGMPPEAKRYHALRSSFVSAALEGGAPADIVRQLSHNESSSRSAFALYDRSDKWPAKCAAVAGIELPPWTP